MNHRKKIYAGIAVYIGSTFLAFRYTRHVTTNVTSELPTDNHSIELLMDEHAKKFDTPSFHWTERLIGITSRRHNMLQNEAHGNVLEIACGTGTNLKHYPTKVQSLTLTDISQNMLALARKNARLLGMEDVVSFRQLDADCGLNRFPAASFDCVVDTHGLCNFENPVQVLREMQRICKPTGKILLLEHGSTGGKYSIIDRYLQQGANAHRANWGCWWNRNILDIINESELIVESCEQSLFGTEYKIIARPSVPVT